MFTYYPKPETPAQWQSNANLATYNRMGAAEELAAWDNDSNVKRGLVRIPAEVIANLHTAKWVEKEAIRLAQRARREAQMNGYIAEQDRQERSFR